MRLLRPSALLAVLALLAGCTPDVPKEIASVFVEASPGVSPSYKQAATLPVSGVSITVMRTALVPAEELLATDVVTAGDPDLRQEFLLVQVDRKAANDILNYTKEAIGKRFVLVVNDMPVGLMPIDQPIVDGNLLFHVEQKGMSNSEAAFDLKRRLNASILKLRKIKASEGR
jgi:hypothetical protein